LRTPLSSPAIVDSRPAKRIFAIVHLYIPGD